MSEHYSCFITKSFPQKKNDIAEQIRGMDFQEQETREVSRGIDVLVVGDGGAGCVAGERSPPTRLGMIDK